MGIFTFGPGSVPIRGTFTLANNTNEQTIIDVANASRIVQDVSVRFNVTALTRNNAIIRIYIAIDADGVVFNEHNRITLAAADTEAHHNEPALASPFRVTIQAASLEGATRSIPYELTQVRR